MLRTASTLHVPSWILGNKIHSASRFTGPVGLPDLELIAHDV